MTDVSVIMTALNEPYVKQTVETILHRSGKELREIIVVDDHSDDPINLDLPKTKVIRNDFRQGLIRGRNAATDISEGQIIVSIDPHCKVSENWLLPIVERIDSNYKCIAIPLTRNLDAESWSEAKWSRAKTGWHWNLDFYWREDESDGKDFTPCFAGHCFAYSKKWWDESGRFDDGMDKWGGENIEFSLRTWLSGGSVEIVRDSWCAHWFKSGFTNYSMDNETLLRNKARIAEVWFGDYKSFFYDAVGKSPGSVDFGDISRRLAVRENLQVRPFEWFLEQFQPELLSVYELKNKHEGGHIAIVGSGPSIDDLNPKHLGVFDVVIGINYSALATQCDYVVFHDMAPALKVLQSGKYHPSQLLVPLQLKDGHGRNVGLSRLLSDKWIVYKLGPQDKEATLKKKNPPFFWHATTAHTAAHIAVFLGAKSVTMFGCDGKFSPDGRSHTRSIPQYRRGFYWPKNKNTENFLGRIERGNVILQSAFRRWKIPLLKVGYL